MTEFATTDIDNDPFDDIVRRAAKDPQFTRVCKWLGAFGLADYDKVTDIFFPVLSDFLLEQYGVSGEDLPRRVFDQYEIDALGEKQFMNQRKFDRKYQILCEDARVATLSKDPGIISAAGLLCIVETGIEFDVDKVSNHLAIIGENHNVSPDVLHRALSLNMGNL